MSDEEQDPKHNMIQLYFSEFRKNELARLWFVVPGGLLTGIPITPDEYEAALYGNTAQKSDDDELGDLLPLEHIEFTMGSTVHPFPLGLLDIDTVSAWGAYAPGRSN